MNYTLTPEPLWQKYASITAAAIGVILYSIIILAAVVIIIGRNIIPSLFNSICCCCCCCGKITKFKSSQNLCQKQENIIVSLFFLFFIFAAVYKLWTCVFTIVGYGARVGTDESFASVVVYTICNVFAYAGFGVFLTYYCCYVILLCHMASVWFHMIDFGSKWKVKLFQGTIGTIVAVCFLVGGVLCGTAVSCVAILRLFDSSNFLKGLFVIGSIHMACEVLLTLTAIALILFMLVMIIKFGTNKNLQTNEERLLKLKIYSYKLLIAMGMLLIANILRLIGFILFAGAFVPAFVGTVLSVVIPDMLDMSVSIIVYWPFALLCCNSIIKNNNSVWSKLIAPINYKALYEKHKTHVGEIQPIEIDNNSVNSLEILPSPSIQEIEQQQQQVEPYPIENVEK